MAKKRTIGRERPGKIFRQRKLEESFAKILRDDKIIFLVDESRFEKLHFSVADDKKTFHTALVLLSRALRGLSQLNAVYDQMIVAYRMAQRYPWGHRLIKRSEHLHFVWMVFANLCYLFEEKFKLTAEAHNSAVVAFNTTGQIKVNEGVKRISKGLREHIQARGEFTHQWRRSHEIIGQYSTIELAHSLGGMPKDFKVKTAYGLSRMLILMEMRQAIRVVEDVLLEVIEAAPRVSLRPTRATS
jgi:hypothetical protein